ncbi:flagellar hook-associated protein FlgK [Aurantimonas sp. VKM B-3413]|uniref:flagellar hook-associated protein FlgK n=1 Tax=Aurantimonas sp. VKM B-3413 TaxID=2779401 RepID=UPI001E2EC287|nr:flagellar hook-associated protein FlgK [Aurantimonas sp. VKM B-3413]MCB8838133.1 flagellar hook-associated protein FlgK [Aurantimonas sp. VKM B-3413]
MSLLSAFTNARSSLATVSAQTALVSRNIANADNSGATRKYANQISNGLGGVKITSISQSENQALFRSMTAANGSLAASKAMSDALNSIRAVIGDVDSTNTPAATLTALKSALADFAVSPEDAQTARAAVDAAKDVVNSLNSATTAIQNARKDADTQLSAAADDMNKLLKQFQSLNDRVVSGTALGTDVTDAIDQRDQIVTKLSGYVGINTQMRTGNDMVLTTDSGITLFETTPRSVEFSAQPAYDATVTGNAFKIDGVSVGASSTMPIGSGSVFGLLKLRDETAITFQGQLDAIATNLVDAFSEASGPGLFSAGTAPGSAGSLDVTAAFDADPTLVRDGSAGQYNTTGSSGFSDRINSLISAMTTQRSFNPALGSGGQSSLIGYAGSSISWLENARATTASDIDYQSTLLTGTQDALSNKTGINLDEEMTHLLDLERSYQASSKIVATIGQMLDTLLNVS